MLFLLVFLIMLSAIFLLFWLAALIIPSFRRESFIYLLFALLGIGGLSVLYYFNPADKAVAGDVYSSVYNNINKQSAKPGEKLPEVSILKLRSPAEVEKILGKPDAPSKPAGSEGKWVIKTTGQPVPATQAAYQKGHVEITFIEGKTARMLVRPGISYFYPGDTGKIFTSIGIKPGPKLTTETNFGADWLKNIPGLYNVHLNFSSGQITELIIVFDEKYK